MCIRDRVYAVKPGDGSAREQAASCQKVLGGWANIAQEYATKRYRSNLINWGMLPLLLEGEPKFGRCDWIYIPNVRTAVEKRLETIEGYVLADGDAVPLKMCIRDRSSTSCLPTRLFFGAGLRPTHFPRALTNPASRGR